MSRRVDDPLPGQERQVEITSRRLVHRGFFTLEVLELRHRRFDGAWSGLLRREFVGFREAVTVIPFDPRHRRLVLVEQFRVGALGTSSAWVLEAPAGVMEPGEAPEAVARRELLEECGITAGRIEHGATFHTSPGGSSELVHLLIAEADLDGAGGVFGLADEGEDIKSHVLDLPTASAWVGSGRVRGVSGILAVQWLQLHHERLAQAWSAAPAPLGAA